MIHVFILLLPVSLALRKDRKKWIKKEYGSEYINKAQKNARRLLNTFVSLGPAYVKLGQWLSSRADILPQPYMIELAKLQDEVPPAPYAQIEKIMRHDLGESYHKLEQINTKAVSGASLGQVYLAKVDGKAVAVKVKRPGIDKVIKEDIAVLKRIFPIALKFVDPNLGFSAKGMLEQFDESIQEEMDYTKEAKNLKEIRDNISDRNDVVIPAVYDELSTKNVLTMEYISGTKVTDIESLDRMGIDRHKLVLDVHKVFFRMLLCNAIFHADPHPGNISVTKEGHLILYDFGMVGRIDEQTRMKLVRLYLALVEKDPSRTVRTMNSLGMLAPDANAELIERAIDLSVQAMHGQKPDQMEVESLLEIANRTMSHFPFLLPKNLALYLRMTSIIEGIYKTHQIEFKFVELMKQILVEENLMYEAYVGEIRTTVETFVKSAQDIISLVPELKKFLNENRQMRYTKKRDAILSTSVISGAGFVGSSILYTSDQILGTVGMTITIVSFAVMLVRKRTKF
ncbi:MAG: Protein kinase [Cenarchaeum symbiont of Oopsacas minuta]|nr:Protein kinase [Cenarchaeum symbiont of Oopsacas minuta]